MIDVERTLPFIVLTVPSGAVDPFKPLLDAKVLAEACAGLATVFILPSEFTWNLTERFGKRLSVYEGAARIYLQGFTEDANPFGGHELVLLSESSHSLAADTALTRLRWMAANASIRRLVLGREIAPFAALRLKSLEERQVQLREGRATTFEQLEVANQLISGLETQVDEAERFQQYFSDLHREAEERAETSESQLRAAGFRIKQLTDQLTSSGVAPDANIRVPVSWPEFPDWCDQNLAGRVVLTPQARRSVKNPEFLDVAQVARCLLWLANDYPSDRLRGGEGSMRDRAIEQGVKNAHCGSDSFEFEWQGKKHAVDWHVKNGGNTRDPSRCLRIYYFWDEQSQQSVIVSMPAHRRTEAS